MLWMEQLQYLMVLLEYRHRVRQFGDKLIGMDIELLSPVHLAKLLASLLALFCFIYIYTLTNKSKGTMCHE